RHLMPATQTYLRAAVHPDGRLLAVAMTDGVGFWDLATGEELRFFAAGWQSDLIFEPEPQGGLLMVGSGGVLRCSIRTNAFGPVAYEIGRPQQLLKVRGDAIALNGDGSIMGLAARNVSQNQPFAGAWLRHADAPDQVRHLDAGKDLRKVSVS